MRTKETDIVGNNWYSIVVAYPIIKDLLLEKADSQSMSFFAWCSASFPSSTNKNQYHETPNLFFSFISGAVISSVFWGCVYKYSSSKIFQRNKLTDLTAVGKDEEGEKEESLTYSKDFATPTDKLLSLTSSGRNVMQSIIRSSEKVIQRTRWPWDRKRNQSNNQTWEDPYGTSTNLSHRNMIEEGSSKDKSVSFHHSNKPNLTEKKKKKKNHGEASHIDIGNIFGLDVGGTLVKLVYFEKRDEPDHFTMSSPQQNRHRRGTTTTLYKSMSTIPSSRPEKMSLSTDSFPILSSDNDYESAKRAESPLHIQNQSLIEESYDTDSTESLSLNNVKRSASMLQFSFHNDTQKALDNFYSFASSLDSYLLEDENSTGFKDVHLNFYSRELRGEFHFVRFETRRMQEAMQLIKKYNMHVNIHYMGATGGGAHKYAKDWEDGLDIRMEKYDELDSLVAGMQFILSDVVGECHTFIPEDSDDKSASTTASTMDSMGTSPTATLNNVISSPRVDDWWWSRKVKRDMAAESSTYPYLLVTIGTGVSVLRVDGPRRYERISGSTIGGGTYWGLCRLLTDVETFKGALDLASKGDPTKVDMMVGDIYGKSDGDALLKLGLSSNTVASSFGKLVAKSDPADGIKEEDLARALLMMVTNNIGQVAYLNAKLHGMSRIYFVGNFLRQNQISQQRLAFAINYWSKGKMEALFLEHEGYFGALGAFLLSQKIGEQRGSHAVVSHSQRDVGSISNLSPTAVGRARSLSV